MGYKFAWVYEDFYKEKHIFTNTNAIVKLLMHGENVVVFDTKNNEPIGILSLTQTGRH